MEYKRFDDTIILRLDKGDEIVESLADISKTENIKAACFHGIGATDCFEIGVFDLEKQDYNRFAFTGNHEITSLEGNITFVDGKPYIHAHITCGNKDARVIGGHLFRAAISLTGEIFISIADGAVTREFNPEIKINRLSF